MSTVPLPVKVKTLRVLRGWNQIDLARRIGFTSRGPIAEFEAGYRELSDKSIASIEAAFGLRLTAPETEAAFAILASDLATAMQVREARLALLDASAA